MTRLSLKSRGLAIFFALAFAVAYTDVAAAQNYPTEEFPASGTFNGKEYDRIIVNYERLWVTLCFVDGTTFTHYNSDYTVFRALIISLTRQREVDEGG